MYKDELQVKDNSLKKLTPAEVVNMAKQYRGFVDWDYMSQLYGAPVERIRIEWAGVYVWQDPRVYAIHEEDDEGWLFEEQYFRGKLRKRLQEAEEWNRVYDGRFQNNVEELKRRVPPKIQLRKDDIVFGASWISTKTYNLALQKFFDLPNFHEIIWKDYCGNLHIDEQNVKNSVRNTNIYGSHRRTACDYMRKLIQAEEIKEFDYIVNPLTGKKKKVENKADTIISKEKARGITEDFVKIIFSDPILLECAEEDLNMMLDYGEMKHDGEYLEISEGNLRQNQKDLISMSLLCKEVLGAQRVGSGKNYAIPFICHLKKEQNPREKTLVILGTNFEGTVDFHRDFYPKDEILVISPKEFTPQKCKETLRKIREEDYVAIYMKSSSYDMVNVSRKWILERSEKEIKKYRSALLSVYDDRKQLRELMKHIQKLEKEYCELLKNYYDPTMCCFDELGVTTLIVDECQEYKNIRFRESLTNIPGNHNNWSQKADKNYKKVRYTLENGGSVIYLTGTPMKNSPTDLYAILYTLMPEELEKCGILGLKQWMLTFGEKTEDVGIDMMGQEFVKKDMFRAFRNCEKLEALCSYVGNFYFEEEEHKDIPKFEGYTDILIQRSPEQAEYIMDCAARAENVRDQLVSPTEDNLLKINTDGRKCALDPQLVMPHLIGKVEGEKVTAAVKMMKQMYDAHPGTTQIGFLDLSTPKESFNLYDECRRKLVELGVPFEEIAFIHDGTTTVKRRKLLNDLNEGKIRIMFGSTQKLGVGVNVQKHLIAIHHLDAPWNPAGLIQRDGRILRQGNENPQVYIFRYVTEASFDAYIWQIIERKVRFFSTLLVGLSTAEEREAGLSARMVLDCAEIKALAIANPLLKERTEKQNKVDELKISKFQREKELTQLKDLEKELPEKIDEKKKWIQKVSLDLEQYQKNKKSIDMEERQAFGEELLEALKENAGKSEERTFDSYQGFQVVLPKQMNQYEPYIILSGAGQYFIKMDGGKALGCSRRLDYMLEHLPERKEKHEEDLEKMKRNLANTKGNLEAGNPYIKELELALEELQYIDRLLEEGETANV